MAKIFYTEGTGAQQTLNESDNNKLKVFDTYEDIDTTDLVDGEVVSTKETSAYGSNVYDYINEMLTKENLLSDYETFTLPTVNTEMQYDGVLIAQVRVASGTDAYIYINDTSVVHTSINTFAAAYAITVPFKKGDMLRCSADQYFTSSIAYYKQRYYGGRQ